MCKKAIILSVLMLGLVACIKDNDPVLHSVENVQVKFNVKALDVGIQPLDAPPTRSGGSKAAASAVLTEIQYYLKNKATGKTYMGKQELSIVGADEFGTVPLWIPTGTYLLVFVGVGVDNPTGTVTMYDEKDYNKVMVGLHDRDAFYLRTEMTVEKETRQIDVNLSRMNGKLVIKLNDVVPVEIKKIKARMGYYSYFNTDTGIATYANSSGAQSVMESYLTIENGGINEFGFFVLQQPNCTLTLSIYDDSGAELGSTNVAVSFYRNKRTVVEGNIFDVINQKPFAVTVSDTWDEDAVVPL